MIWTNNERVAYKNSQQIKCFYLGITLRVDQRSQDLELILSIDSNKNKKMRKNRDFDIITGESSSMTRRSFSQADQVFNPNHIRRLGSPRDHKEFQYAYFQRLHPVSHQKQETHKQFPDHKNRLDSSMLNCVSTPYNIINHSGQNPTSKIVSHDMFNIKLPEVNKKSPLTVHLKASSIFSPNYRADYPQRQARHQFHMKSNSFLEDICQNEKRSPGRYFRKYK